MPVLKDSARIFPLRPLGSKEETEKRNICTSLTSHQSFPSERWSQQCSVPTRPQAELAPSLSGQQPLHTRPTADILLNVILPGLHALTCQRHWGASWGSCPHRAARWPGYLVPPPAAHTRQSGSEWLPPRPSRAHWPADCAHWRSPVLWLKLPGPLGRTERQRQGENRGRRRTPGARQGR